MSEQTAVPTVQAPTNGLPDYGAGPQVAPDFPAKKQVYSCGRPGCAFKTTSEAGMKRHTTRKHGTQKPATKRVAQVLTPSEKKVASIPNLRPIWKVDENEIILVHPDGSIWSAQRMKRG